MRKFFGLMALWAIVISGFMAVAYGANTCTPTDWWCYVSGPSQSPTTQARLDATGNLTLTGNATVTGNETVTGNISLTGNQTTVGKTIYTPVSVTAISSTTVITPTSTFILVTSTGNNVTCGLNALPVVAPCIATATATSGQYLVIGSTQAQMTVTFSSGTASAMDLGAATRVVGAGKILTLIYNAALSIWTEVSYANN